ncbi:MAG: 16S rRNA (guanine(527)-N(7))-methyltransferase RsmG [Rhodobacteraceae bacterium]|nr:16S rRNA (guanine(527)-N(7))-methyltransferase RsmG [Paracoccaceae bacterium]
MSWELADVGISGEIIENLQIYLDLLKKWNARINLVSEKSLKDAWTRHFKDSAQLWEHSGDGGKWLDMGSGAGFPGMVLAIINHGEGNRYRFCLVESDARKCAFLRTVSRETKINTEIITIRIENLPFQKADVISARALASLTDLLSYAKPHLKNGGFALYLKGQKCGEEVEKAKKMWYFRSRLFPSSIDSNAFVAKIWDLKRAI